MGTKAMIAECLDLMNRIEKESPPEPDLEALHSVTGIYAKLKEYRDELQSFPPQARAFSEFLHAAKSSSQEMTNFLNFIKSSTGVLSSPEKETFLEKRQRIAGLAERAGLEPARLFHLLSLSRLKGILDKKDTLFEDFRSVITEYLEP